MMVFAIALEERGHKNKLSPGPIFTSPQKRRQYVNKLRKRGDKEHGRVFLYSGEAEQILAIPKPPEKPKPVQRHHSAPSKTHK